MINKSKLASLVAILTIVFLSLSPIAVLGQYETQQSVNVTVPSTGITHIDQNVTVGDIAIDIAGTPGATGLVSTATYTQNPQPDASVPENIALTHFVVITFNMNAADFKNATITIHYSDADVANINPPYVLFKYNPENNSYTPLNAVADTAAKTITATLTSTSDPLFAIGGATTTPSSSPVFTPVSPITQPTPSEEPTTISLAVWGQFVIIIELATLITVIGVGVYQNRSPTATARKSK